MLSVEIFTLCIDVIVKNYLRSQYNNSNVFSFIILSGKIDG